MAEEHHHVFPARWAFLLNNPIRRWISPPKRLISKLGIGSGDTVVDFGSGPGFFTVPVAKVAGRVIAVDVSPDMLEQAKHNSRQQRVHLELLQSDGRDLKLDSGSVDLILVNHVFHEVKDKTATLREFLRVLKPSGRVAIIERTHGRRILPGPPVINKERLEGRLRESGFSVKAVPYGHDSIIFCEKLTSN